MKILIGVSKPKKLFRAQMFKRIRSNTFIITTLINFDFQHNKFDFFDFFIKVILTENFHTIFEQDISLAKWKTDWQLHSSL
jgi:hypothetical protein